MTNLILQKTKQRKKATTNRILINKSFQNKLFKFKYQFFEKQWFKKSKIIASFLPIKSEISTDHINRCVLKHNKILCLPVITNNLNFLIFREYKLGDKLIVGKFTVLEPYIIRKEYLPDIIFTPCLAFDKDGYRLGYGGGYYDKTFSYYKKINHPYISIAVAYDDQKVDEVIHDHLDQKLDYILTEKDLYKVS